MAEKMKASIRKIATFLEETRIEMGRVVDPPTRRAAAVAVIENLLRGKVCRRLVRTHADRRGTGRIADAARSRGPGHSRNRRRELWQGCGRWRKRGTRTRSGDSPSQAGRAGTESSRQRRRAHSVFEEARRTWALLSTSPSATKMQLSCAVTSMAWKSESMTLPGPTKSWSPSQ